MKALGIEDVLSFDYMDKPPKHSSEFLSKFHSKSGDMNLTAVSSQSIGRITFARCIEHERREIITTFRKADGRTTDIAHFCQGSHRLAGEFFKI